MGISDKTIDRIVRFYVRTSIFAIIVFILASCIIFPVIMFAGSLTPRQISIDRPLSISLISVRTENEIKAIKPRGTFLIVNVKLTNRTDQSMAFGPGSFQLTTARGDLINPDHPVSAALEGDLYNSHLEPGATSFRSIAFDVLSPGQEWQLQVHADGMPKNQWISVPLK